MSSPTQRSLKHLRAEGWHADTTERWIPGANIRRDLFGFIDLIAIKAGERPRAVQTTSSANMASRIAKIRESDLFPLVAQDFDVVVHGWAKRKLKRGGKAVRWQVREEVVNG